VGFLSGSQNEFKIIEKPAFTYVYMSFTGSYKTMPQKITAFMGEFFKQGLQPLGTLLTVYHNSPERVEESKLKWDVGFPLTESVTIKEPLKTGVYQAKKVLEYIHKGSYDKLPQVYQKLNTYIDKKGLTMVLPTFEFYLNNPQQVKPEQLLTRIEIPIKK
jgi:effector-binding domain-containing protein